MKEAYTVQFLLLLYLQNLEEFSTVQWRISVRKQKAANMSTENIVGEGSSDINFVIPTLQVGF